MNLAVKIMLALRRAPTLELGQWPAGVQQAFQTLQTAAKSDAADRLVAEMRWQRRRDALAARGVELPDWSKPSVRRTAEGQAAMRVFHEARQPQLSRDEARALYLAKRRLG